MTRFLRALMCVALVSGAAACGDDSQPSTRFALQVSLDGGGSGTVTSSAGISCGAGGSQCRVEVEAGTSVTLVATPESGSEFVGWGGACTGSGACTVVLDADQTVSATFEPAGVSRSLSVSIAAGSGSVTSNPSGIDCPGACTSTFSDGSTVTLTASPAQGFVFSGWGEACSGTGTCVLTLDADLSVTASFQAESDQYTLSVSLQGGGTGDVLSSPTGIDCGTNQACDALFSSGTSVTLTATPQGGSTFQGWSGACSGTDTCVVSVTSDLSVVASFAPPANTYSLSVTLQGSGTGTVSSSPTGIDCPSGACSSSFSGGTQITLTAAPTGNSVFSGWSGPCSGTGSCIVTLTSDVTVYADFSPPSMSRLTVDLSGTGTGSVSSSPTGLSCSGTTCTGDFLTGTQVTLTAAPDQFFGGWSGACGGSDLTCVVTLSSDVWVGASFDAGQQLEVTVSGSGTVTSVPAGINCGGVCTATYATDSSVVLTASPGNGYVFDQWSGSSCEGSTSLTCEVSMVSGESVTAHFVATYTLSVSLSGFGTITSYPGSISCTAGPCFENFNEGTQVTLYASEAQGFVFTGWGGACASAGTDTQCVLSMTQDRTVTATFLELFSVTVTVEPSGRVISSPAGIDCWGGGICTADFPEGTALTLTAIPETGASTFAGWFGDCTGTSGCSVTVDGDLAIDAHFAVVSLSNEAQGKTPYFSMIPSETRTVAVTASLVSGTTPVPLALTLGNMPAGVTGILNPDTVTQPGTSILSLTSSGAEPGTYTVVVTGTAGSQVRTTELTLDIRSPHGFRSQQSGWGPVGVQIEDGGATALVTENDRLVRVDIPSRITTKTLASGYGEMRHFAIEPGGASSIVVAGDSILRVTHATGAVSVITTGLIGPFGVALEASNTALVTDCGTGDCGTAGRLVRVDLATGATSVITSLIGLNLPHGVALEASTTTALVAEAGTGKLLRISLGSGSAATMAVGLGPIEGVAIEGGGTSALVAGPYNLYRVTLATGTVTRIAKLSTTCCNIPGLSGIAIESSGTSALVIDRGPFAEGGRLVRTVIDVPHATLAPARQSLQALYSPYGVAVEAGGTTALMTDCGAGDCGTTGRLVRVNVATGIVTQIAWSPGIQSPMGVALEPSRGTALVAEAGQSRLLRITVPGGGVTVLATGITGIDSIAVDEAETFAYVTGAGSLYEVNLANGATRLVATLSSTCCNIPALRGIAIEPGGLTALILDSAPNDATGTRQRLLRVNLSDGASAVISSGFTSGLFSPGLVGVVVEASGTTALVTEAGETGRLYRVDLTTGDHIELASDLDQPAGLSLEASGDVLMAEALYHHLHRVMVDAAITPHSRAYAVNRPTGVVVEPGGGTALFLDCGSGVTPNCLTNGRLVRLDLSTGAQTLILSGLNTPSGLAIEAGGDTVLVTDCGPASGSCSDSGQLLQVDLVSQTAVQLVSNINTPDGIAIEDGGATALVAERGAGRILRANLGGGFFDFLAAGLTNPRQVTLEAGGASALISTDRGIERLDLGSGEVSYVLRNYQPVERFALEESTGTLIFVWGGAFGSDASLVRAVVESGGVTYLAPGLTYYAHTLVLEPGGTTALLTEARDNTGAIYRMTIPPP